jgi:hypothetical protein
LVAARKEALKKIVEFLEKNKKEFVTIKKVNEKLF